MAPDRPGDHSIRDKGQVSMGWIGVDLDGTLAYYGHAESAALHQGWVKIGYPLMPMVHRVHQWLAEGRDVRIVTARVAPHPKGNIANNRAAIEEWCLQHLGKVLPVTNSKDWEMVELWDDRAIQVVTNTGEKAL
jgi:hypothetical protein